MSAVGFNNATRITTPHTVYPIPLVYPKGRVYWRIRGVRYHNGHREQSRWTSMRSSSDNLVLGKEWYWAEGHQSNLNWQMQAVFAEEGKRSQAATYFDGSLRNRQKVLRSDAIDMVIASETIYDSLGRATVQVMPAPVSYDSAQAAWIRRIQYIDSFALAPAKTSYSAVDFHFTADSCTVTGWNPAAPMDSATSAVSRYYSSRNPERNKFMSKFTPAADGFPFSVTEYESDPTGRARRQGGVGPTFQLGSGHETRYFYSKPDQDELDRLFGNEAGYAAHYQKNAVMDPNGQISVTYIDAHGRTVATALAGAKPANLEQLPNFSTAAQIKKNLLHNLADELALRSTYSLFVSSASDAQLESPDFFNKYGDRVVQGFLGENNAIAAALRLDSGDDNNSSSARSDLAEMFSRRIALLTVEEQERAYAEVLARYNEYVEDLKQRGEYDLEVEYLPLEAETQEQFLLEEGSGRPTPFGQPAVLEQVQARVLKRPMKWSEVQAIMEKALQGASPEEFQKRFRQEYEAGRQELRAAKSAERTAKLRKVEDEIRELEILRDSGKSKDVEKLEKGLEKANKQLAELKEKMAAEETKLTAETNNGLRIIDFFKVGRPFQFRIEQAGTARELNGVVTGLYFLKPAGDPTRYNPANVRITAAIYGPERTWTLKFNSPEVFTAMGMSTYNQEVFLQDLLYNWNRHDSAGNKREEQFIATGNMLLSAKNVFLQGAGGKLIKYSTFDGGIRSGILVQKEVDHKGREQKSEPKTRRSVRALAEELAETRPGYQQYRYVEGTALNNAIAFVRTREEMYRVTMPKTTAFKPYYGDKDLVNLLFQDTYDRSRGLPKAFVSYPPNLLAGYLHHDDLQTFLDILADKYQMTYLAEAQQFGGFLNLDQPIPDREPSEMEQMLVVLEQLNLEISP